MQRVATCSCGELTVRCTDDPVLVSMCHCVSCQKRTGAPYGLAAFYHKENVQVSGGYRSFERSSDSGYPVRFHFCGTCGSTVFWEPSRKPGMFAIAVGAFGDPCFPGPSQEVHTESRHAWIKPLKA